MIQPYHGYQEKMFCDIVRCFDLLCPCPPELWLSNSRKAYDQLSRVHRFAKSIFYTGVCANALPKFMVAPFSEKSSRNMASIIRPMRRESRPNVCRALVGRAKKVGNPAARSNVIYSSGEALYPRTSLRLSTVAEPKRH